MSDIFLFDLDSYNRHIDPVNDYIEQTSTYLSKVKGVDKEVAKQKIIEMINNREGPFSKIINRQITFTEKNQYGDREVRTDSIVNYIQNVTKNNYIMAPTLTTYIHHDVYESFTVKFVEDNKKQRAIAKKAQFKYESEGDIVKASFYNLEQTNRKIANNSMSGAMSSPSTPLYNKTGHSTLTSGTRVTTSNSNSHNEKLLTGNRHYFSIDIILNNITYIVSELDKNELKLVMDKYKLYYPSVNDCVNVIKRSSHFYYIDDISPCLPLLNSLDELERAWFIYCNDFYHICMYNEVLMKDFLTKISSIKYEDKDFDISLIKEYDEIYVNAGHQMCADYIKGYGKDYEKMKKDGILKYLIPTIENIKSTLTQMSDFFSLFFRNKVVPHNVADFPSSVRRAVLTSDTDSTIYTSQELIFWYLGKTEFNQIGKAIQAFLVGLSSFTTRHVLHQMSAQFGIPKNRLNDINMKSEFTFDVYSTTQVAKHYYATISIQEGNVFEKVKREFKGVQLVSSNLPLKIKELSKNMMNEIMDKTINNEKLSIVEYLTEIRNVEQDIISSVQKGDLTYFKIYKIKDKNSYTDGLFSAYFYSELWNEVFAYKTESIDTYPFQAIKLSTTLISKKKMNDWLNLLDNDIKLSMSKWIEKSKRQDLPMIMLPADIIRSYGLPKELHSIVNYRKMVSEICHVFYMILESLGFYLKTDHIVSDYFT